MKPAIPLWTCTWRRRSDRRRLRVYPSSEGDRQFAGIDSLTLYIESFRDNGDDFDRFCSDRDRGRSLPGLHGMYFRRDCYEDLDDNGGWRSVPSTARSGFHTPRSLGGRLMLCHGMGFALGLDLVDDAPWGLRVPLRSLGDGRWRLGLGPCAPRAVVVSPMCASLRTGACGWVGGPHSALALESVEERRRCSWFPLGPHEVTCLPIT